MKNYYRVMLGRKSERAADCFAGGFLGAGFGINEDLSQKLPDEWREFNKQFIPVLLAKYPNKSKISAGLNCGALWTVSKGIKMGDMVLSPDGTGSYRVGEVIGDYYYAAGDHLPHRRKVRWSDTLIPRSSMSTRLRSSAGSSGTVCEISSHQAEIDELLGSKSAPAPLVAVSPEIEDPMAFAMEEHLEEFLVTNWNQTELSKEFSIFEEDGETVGQQYQTDAGAIDILAIRKDKKRLLVVELKRGRASDVVVGQLLRYMGFVKEEVAEEGQTVEGVIIAREEDPKLRWALAAVPSVSFYRYQVSFKLIKG